MMKRLSVIVISFTVCLMLSIPCLAADISLLKLPDTDDIGVLTAEIGSDYSGKKGEFVTYFKIENGCLVMDSMFNDIKPSERIAMISEFVERLSRWDISNLSRQAIYTSIAEGIDDSIAAYIPEIKELTTADLAAAYAWYIPFSGIVGTLLGVGVIILVLFLVFSSTLDLLYLGMPAMSDFIDTGNEGLKKLLIVSREARAAAKETTLGSKSNIYALYLKRRWWTILLIAICILYLISGQLGSIIGWFMSVAEAMTG